VFIWCELKNRSGLLRSTSWAYLQTRIDNCHFSKSLEQRKSIESMGCWLWVLLFCLFRSTLTTHILLRQLNVHNPCQTSTVVNGEILFAVLYFELYSRNKLWLNHSYKHRSTKNNFNNWLLKKWDCRIFFPHFKSLLQVHNRLEGIFKIHEKFTRRSCLKPTNFKKLFWFLPSLLFDILNHKCELRKTIWTFANIRMTPNEFFPR